ncbi:hypothetical protein ABIF70_004200 [Bradyrhizobium japonicum]
MGASVRNCCCSLLFIAAIFQPATSQPSASSTIRAIRYAVSLSGGTRLSSRPLCCRPSRRSFARRTASSCCRDMSMVYPCVKEFAFAVGTGGSCRSVSIRRRALQVCPDSREGRREACRPCKAAVPQAPVDVVEARSSAGGRQSGRPSSGGFPAGQYNNPDCRSKIEAAARYRLDWRLTKSRSPFLIETIGRPILAVQDDQRHISDVRRLGETISHVAIGCCRRTHSAISSA